MEEALCGPRTLVLDNWSSDCPSRSIRCRRILETASAYTPAERRQNHLTRKIASILVLVALLPQLVLGMGSGRVLELCFCGMLETESLGSLWHACDHSHDDGHHHHSKPCDPDSDPASEGAESNQLPSHSCDHLIVAGQYGRAEPVQTWNLFTLLDALSSVRVELCLESVVPDRYVRPELLRPPSDHLYVVQTTILLI